MRYWNVFSSISKLNRLKSPQSDVSGSCHIGDPDNSFEILKLDTSSSKPEFTARMVTVKAKGDKGIAKAKAEGHVGKELNKELEEGSLPTL